MANGHCIGQYSLRMISKTWQTVKTELLFKETPQDFVISQTNFWTLARLMSVWFKEFYLLQTPAIPRGNLMATSDESLPHNNEIDCGTPPLDP